MSEPCRRVGYKADGTLTDLLASCPDCGHTGLVHPGLHNRSVKACVICQMETVWAALDQHKAALNVALNSDDPEAMEGARMVLDDAPGTFAAFRAVLDKHAGPAVDADA